MIEHMVKELLDRLSGNAEQINQDSSITYELSNELVVPYLDFHELPASSSANTGAMQTNNSASA